MVYPDELPVYGAGSVRVLSGDKWTAGRKERGSDEHMAVWARRLLVAAQLAEGVGPAHIAASLDVDRSVVYNDIRALNEHGLLMPGREPANDVIAKILIRLEYLQRVAFEDLIDAEEAEALLQLRIRVEIEKRELATFEDPQGTPHQLGCLAKILSAFAGATRTCSVQTKLITKLSDSVSRQICNRTGGS